MTLWIIIAGLTMYGEPIFIQQEWEGTMSECRKAATEHYNRVKVSTVRVFCAKTLKPEQRQEKVKS